MKAGGGRFDGPAGIGAFKGIDPGVRLAMAVLNARLAGLRSATARYFFLGITSRCQLGCAHCRYRQPGAARPRADMTPSAAARIFSAAARAGVPRVILFGGEPTLHPRILRIVNLASSAGLFTEMDTNGLALRRKGFLSALRKAGLCAVRVSVHSPGRREHDALAGEGSFDAAAAALRLARREGLLCYVSSCALPGKERAMAALAAFASKIGAHGLRVLPYAAPGSPPGLPLRLSRELARSAPAGYAGTCVPHGKKVCAAVSGESLYIDNSGCAWTCPFSGVRLGRADESRVFRARRRPGGPGSYPCLSARPAGR